MGPYAGVLPWAWHTDGPVILLGRERYEPGWRDAGRWSDFGGGVEPSVDRDELAAAAREAYEETMGMLGSRSEIESALRAEARGGRLIEARSPKGGVVFLWQVPFDQRLPILFERAYAYAREAAAVRASEDDNDDNAARMPKGYYEKSSVAWVPVDRLIDAVNAALPVAQARALGQPTPDDPGLLRDDFARTVVEFFGRPLERAAITRGGLCAWR
jgi:hypothetical protein